MPRERSFTWNLYLPLTQLDRALTGFYAHRYGQDKREIIRSILHKYIRADARFDAKAFLKYVQEVLLKEEEADPELQEELMRASREFVDAVKYAREQRKKTSEE